MSSPESIPRPEYPRPRLVRAEWLNLNGYWTFELDPGKSGLERGLAASTGFDRSILVPFCPESVASGVAHTDFIERMFYHRKVTVPESWRGRRVLMHFGAVDYQCEGFLDGESVGGHFGGSSGFCWDLTDRVRFGAEQDFVLMVSDFTRGALQPVGKQSFDYRSGGCCYTRTTGIWQTVWLEPVHPNGLKSCRITPDFDDGAFIFAPAFLADDPTCTLRVKVLADGAVAAQTELAAVTGASCALKLPAPRPWSPDDPFLYDVALEVVNASGVTLDAASSYSGLRKVHTANGKFYLNNHELFLRLVLDQGFYPEGGWTAPSDAALKRDIELAMAAGFNGARLHQKVFEPRFHYWADKLGYLT